ncbi:MAG TPA: hypothetical protein VLG40_02490 [Candidatus Saccharimonas sp.]|nr:hypothetical protein [Candidatus Saccharimonas sp.]
MSGGIAVVWVVLALTGLAEAVTADAPRLLRPVVDHGNASRPQCRQKVMERHTRAFAVRVAGEKQGLVLPQQQELATVSDTVQFRHEVDHFGQDTVELQAEPRRVVIGGWDKPHVHPEWLLRRHCDILPSSRLHML